MKAELVTITPNYIQLIQKAMGECYQRPVGEKTVKKAVQAGHLSVLEHCVATFEITCSTSVLLQLTRHRHFSFTVQSSRGCVLTNFHKTGIPFVDDLLIDHMADYNYAVEEGCEHKEDAAYLLPKAAEYRLLITGNFRAWYDYLPKRMCKRAQKEHRELAYAIQKALAKAAPEIFDKDFLNCDECKEKSCSFD